MPLFVGLVLHKDALAAVYLGCCRPDGAEEVVRLVVGPVELRRHDVAFEIVVVGDVGMVAAASIGAFHLVGAAVQCEGVFEGRAVLTVAFVEVDDEYQGLIHISEISYGYVKNINDYVKIGDKIYTEVIKVDESNNQLQLSIKDIDYKNDGKRLIRMAETKSGFEPLKERLDVWISEKIKEVTDKM